MPYTLKVHNRYTTFILDGETEVGIILRANKQWWIMRDRKPVWPEGFEKKETALAKFEQLQKNPG